jgi:hypothetical protein
LGLGHSAAYLVGALVLGVVLARRVHHALVPRQLPVALGCAVPLAVVGWFVFGALDPSGRIATAVVVAGLCMVGAGAYVLAVRRFWRFPAAPERLVGA